MVLENFAKFIRYYGKGQKFKLFGFFVLSTIAGCLEFLGVALIYPVVLLIVKPDSIIHTKYYVEFVKFSHIHDVLANAFLLAAIVALLFIAKNLFMIITLYLQNRFFTNWKLTLGKKFMYHYLFSPYKTVLKTSPSEKLYTINFLINQSIDCFVYRITYLFANMVIVLMILALLLVKFLPAAIFTGTFVAFSMSFQNRFFKKKLGEISKDFSEVSAKSNEKILENINNLKEIKMLSAENYFYNDYANTQKSFSTVLFENNFYGAMPPYIIEILIVLSLFIMAGIISLQNIESSGWMVASYAIIVAAIFRIAPALNRVQSSFNIINTSRAFVKTLILEYESSNLDYIEQTSDFRAEFKDKIKLNNINFSYRKLLVIKDLNLEIKKGEFIGIIGPSGAGKSTLADIIMGLLPPDNGEIIVDDVEFNRENYSALRKLIGYVPQQINIMDGTFKRNVALGIEDDKIDEAKVIKALKQAQIYDFVNGFENGINAKVIVGANGLSQGQKQRLAIARALYRDSEILIFDEATSSLDVETEHEITQMLNDIKKEKTIIAIAHRLSTLKSCDKLIYMKNGEIVDIGNFMELSIRHADFDKLIKLSNIK